MKRWEYVILIVIIVFTIPAIIIISTIAMIHFVKNKIIQNKETV